MKRIKDPTEMAVVLGQKMDPETPCSARVAVPIDDEYLSYWIEVHDTAANFALWLSGGPEGYTGYDYFNTDLIVYSA